MTSKADVWGLRIVQRVHEAEIRTLKRRLVTVERQRDAAKGRAAELRAYVTKYQRELATLRRILRKGPHE